MSGSLPLKSASPLRAKTRHSLFLEGTIATNYYAVGCGQDESPAHDVSRGKGPALSAGLKRIIAIDADRPWD
jgi:hypothetical protein